MTIARPHISLVTLGVTNLPRAIAFYEAVGLQRADFDSPRVAFFDMGGLALGLYGWDALAEDARRAFAAWWSRSRRRALKRTLQRSLCQESA
jgi:catechol 2,3-dioxygenase-like lactoylglutathione lyase family enzyme